jgi:hypothetical protein
MARNKLQFDINAKDKTKRAFSTLKRGLKGVSKAIFNMKTGLAAVAGVAGLGLMIRNSLNSIDKIGKLSRQLFISTEDLGAFRLAAELGGTSLEAFAKGSRTLAVGINDWLVKGTGIAKEAFEQLGITAEELRATNNDLFAQFELVADALKNMEDGTNKTAIAYKLFGGRNIELLTAIENGTMGMAEMRIEAERLGLVMDSRLVGMVEAANDSMSRSKLAIVGLTHQFSAALAPSILKVSDAIREKFLHWIEKTHGSVTGFGNYLADELLDSLFGFAKIMIHITEATINTAIALGNLGIAAANAAEFFKFRPEYKEFHKFLDISKDKIEDMELVFQSLEQTKNPFEDSMLWAQEDAENTENVNKRKIKATDTFHKRLEEFVHEERRFDLARLRSVEETEKAKKALRAKAMTDIRSNLEGTLTILSGNSKKMFKLLQAHKIAEAIVNTYSAVMKAFSTYPPPWSYAAAGSALAFGMAQVSQIRAQKFTARRQGGAVSENKPYMVGEGGPEVMIPNSSGFVSPNLGGKNVNVNFTINAVDTAGFQQLLANERGMIVGMINSAVNQQGKSDII